MIEIPSFRELFQLHQSGNVPFRIVQEVAYVLLGLCGYEDDIPEPIAITQQEIDWLLNQPQDLDFMHYMGGLVFIAETRSDLLQITSMDTEFGEQHGRWPNCTEAVLALDECRYVLNAGRTAEYVLMFSATNNAGGSTWFIPPYLWETARVAEHIAATQQFWSKQQ